MLLDLTIILSYFAIIFAIGIRSRVKKGATSEEYFLGSRSLRWPSVAISTIATNIQAGHFIGMAGSAYVFGLAQANLEINAIFGILMAAFFFVPLFLRMKVTTITQFFEARFGAEVALAYSGLMIVLYGFLYLGAALFWGAYAIEGAFGGMVAFLGPNPIARISVLVLVLGTFSAAYTYLGGFRAVVRTDLAQFALLTVGGLVTVLIAVNVLGGWSQLWAKTGNLMHLHLPADHSTLPWIAIFGMNLLNLQYWGANQVILQRALAAKSLWHAQFGLLVGGLLKYMMALIIVIPGIALAGILRDSPLKDPDQAYITLVNNLLPTGLRGVILCGLFASLMSTIDSIYNSVSTLWSVDIYKRHLRPDASEAQVVAMGKKAIVVALITGVAAAFVHTYVKFADPGFPLTHWFNEVSYYAKNGIAMLIMAAVFLLSPSRRLVLGALLFSVPLTYMLKVSMPSMNYFVRAGWIIVLTFGVVAIPTVIRHGWRIPLRQLLIVSRKDVCHVVLH
jgi:SSS family solute:Na+ symporter